MKNGQWGGPIFDEFEPWSRTTHLDDTRLGDAANELAVFLKYAALHAQAEPLYRQPLALHLKSLGQDHPEVAINLGNLATLLSETNRFQEAETLTRRALAIDEKILGPEHPSVGRDLNNLAMLLKETNRFAEMGPMFVCALAIDEKNHGSDHPRRHFRLNIWRCCIITLIDCPEQSRCYADRFKLAKANLVSTILTILAASTIFRCCCARPFG